MQYKNVVNNCLSRFLSEYKITEFNDKISSNVGAKVTTSRAVITFLPWNDVSTFQQIYERDDVVFERVVGIEREVENVREVGNVAEVGNVRGVGLDFGLIVQAGLPVETYNQVVSLLLSRVYKV